MKEEYTAIMKGLQMQNGNCRENVYPKKSETKNSCKKP